MNGDNVALTSGKKKKSKKDKKRKKDITIAEDLTVEQRADKVKQAVEDYRALDHEDMVSPARCRLPSALPHSSLDLLLPCIRLHRALHACSVMLI